MQRALLELALLAMPAGVLGAFVLLRRLAFFTHALGVGTFPGAVVAAVDAVGVLLVSSLFVVPAAAARLLTRRLLPLAAVSSLLALLAAFIGLLVSFHTGTPPGATVAVAAAGIFLTAYTLRGLAEPRRRRRVALALAGGAVLLLAACGGGSGHAHGSQLDIAATTTQVSDWVRQIGGKDVHVTQLLKPLVDPHEFEPGPAD